MHRWITRLLAVGFIASSLLAWLLYCGCNGDGRESFGDKHEWSILQVLEYRSRGTSISGLEFSQHEKYRIVALPAVTGERMWIMLNPQSPPYYKQMPQTNYTLTEGQYQQIVRTQHPTATVEVCLSSHLQREPLKASKSSNHAMELTASRRFTSFQ
jgi:hypothetical protein